MPKTLTQAELVARSMSERELQDSIIQLAEFHAWAVLHVRDSRKQRVVGLPDLLLLRPPDAMWWELKSQHGKVTEIQQQTMDLLSECGFDVNVVRPGDWLSGWVKRNLQ